MKNYTNAYALQLIMLGITYIASASAMPSPAPELTPSPSPTAPENASASNTVAVLYSGVTTITVKINPDDIQTDMKDVKLNLIASPECAPFFNEIAGFNKEHASITIPNNYLMKVPTWYYDAQEVRSNCRYYVKLQLGPDDNALTESACLPIETDYTVTMDTFTENTAPLITNDQWRCTKK